MKKHTDFANVSTLLMRVELKQFSPSVTRGPGSSSFQPSFPSAPPVSNEVLSMPLVTKLASRQELFLLRFWGLQ